MEKCTLSTLLSYDQKGFEMTRGGSSDIRIYGDIKIYSGSGNPELAKKIAQNKDWFDKIS